MSKVVAKILNHGAILCYSVPCAFKRICANHVSANIERQQQGMTPELSVDWAKLVYCKTIDRVADISDDCKIIPVGYYKKAKKGMVCRDKDDKLYTYKPSKDD